MSIRVLVEVEDPAIVPHKEAGGLEHYPGRDASGDGEKVRLTSTNRPIRIDLEPRQGLSWQTIDRAGLASTGQNLPRSSIESGTNLNYSGPDLTIPTDLPSNWAIIWLTETCCLFSTSSPLGRPIVYWW